MNTRAAVSVRLLAYSASRARGPLLTAATVRAYHLSTFRTQAFSAAAAPRRILFAHPVPKHHVSGAREYSSNDKPSDVAESVKEQLGSVGADIFQLQHEHEEIAFIFRLFQSVLESLHDGALLGHAIPWWGVIAGSVVVLRLGVAFPAFVYQQRGLAKVRKLDKVVTAWTKTIAHSIKSENANAPLSETQFLQVLKRRMRLKRQELLVQHGCHPLFYVLMSISQLPIWVSMTFALRRLSRGFWWANTTAAASFSAAPGMSTEGVLWFTDLSAVDPTYILPACTGAV
ncbi:Cytochrome c oxidase assembly protein cox18, mitochondrial, partial [Coemansia sp. RSA 2559]